MDKLDERKKQIEILLTNLEVISNIGKNEKLCVKNENGELDVDKRYFQSFRRYFSGDSRDNLVECLTRLSNSMDTELDYLLIKYTESDNPDETGLTSDIGIFINHMLHDLYIKSISAKKGLGNLRDTYDDDVAVKSKIDLNINKLERKTLNIKNRLSITE